MARTIVDRIKNTENKVCGIDDPPVRTGCYF